MSGEEEAGRGQVLVIAGLLLAILFVPVALMRNSAIATENRATTATSEIGSCTVAEFHSKFQADATELIDRTNAGTPTTNSTKIVDRIRTNLRASRDSTIPRCAKRGRSVAIDVRQLQKGTQLRQTNESRDFTDKNGNWTLTGAAPGGGQFAVAIQGASLYEDDLDTSLATLTTEAFRIEFHLADYDGAGDGVWRIFFYQGASPTTCTPWSNGPTRPSPRTTCRRSTAG
jgi:hypothetical protein